MTSESISVSWRHLVTALCLLAAILGGSAGAFAQMPLLPGQGTATPAETPAAEPRLRRSRPT
ncbi:hypothetical protein [Methylobrevis pamukkalensis]|uniref:Uncharacterized protein n=1 Tax=Methylobrevis pamukkalensis TaxID=1439726 RepID=A0A1E3GX75_9HYPH|nr:hypothetical protein [Methylobrevis pamukkalensis]ODN68604.1 hypothetical protein A6302_04102 [Methylobrevis pamukkalensis]